MRPRRSAAVLMLVLVIAAGLPAAVCSAADAAMPVLRRKPAVLPATGAVLPTLPRVVTASGVADVAGPAPRSGTCATSVAPAAELEQVRNAVRRAHEEPALRPSGGGTIRIAFHVITDGGRGDVSDARIGAQVDELNRSFAGSGYRFELTSVDRTDSRAWFAMDAGTPGAARRALAVDPGRHLNFYIGAPEQMRSGWATFPWSAAEDDPIHGVVVHHASLPGGEVSQDQGRADAVHQVTHYLGIDACVTQVTGDVMARAREIVPVYRPSLFAPAAAPARDTGSLTEGSEPEDGRVLAYRGAIPNPFHGATAIRFTLPQSEVVSLKVFSVTGQLVRTLVEAQLPPGDHSAMFRAGDLPSGVYFSVLRAGAVQMTRTLVLVR